MDKCNCSFSATTYNTGKSPSSAHTHTFKGPFSGTTQVSRYQKGKPIWILLKQEIVSGNGISWAIGKSAPCSRQITMPAPQYSVFYRPDAIPATQPTAYSVKALKGKSPSSALYGKLTFKQATAYTQRINI